MNLRVGSVEKKTMTYCTAWKLKGERWTSLDNENNMLQRFLVSDISDLLLHSKLYTEESNANRQGALRFELSTDVPVPGFLRLCTVNKQERVFVTMKR